MKTARAVAIVVLICAAVTFSYWIGYERGQGSREVVVASRNEHITPEERNDTIEPLPRIQETQVKIPPRDPAAKAHLIDLSSWYNAGLKGNWHGGESGNDLGAITPGVHTFAGTEFDVRGLLQLRGPDPGSKSFPRSLDGIELRLRCRKLHFLHNTLFARRSPRGQIIGAYVLHYADDESVTVPLRIGENVLDWWGSPTQLPLGGSTVLAWQGINAVSAKRGQSIHLNKFTWENPRPDAELQTLDFVSEVKFAGPFLVAVTAEP